MDYYGFSSSDQTVMKLLETFKCPEPSFLSKHQISSGGYANAVKKEETVIQIQGCHTGLDVVCDNEEIEVLKKTLDVEIIFINANFDPKSMKRPISYYFDKRLNQQILPEL